MLPSESVVLAMEVVRLAIIGAGSMRCTPTVVGSLATYFGERPLEVRMFDADEERLDLFARFATSLFRFNSAPHTVMATLDVEEALSGADFVILQVGENCARRFLKRSPGQNVQEALSRISLLIPGSSEVLSLQKVDIQVPLEGYRSLPCEPEPDLSKRGVLAHQILRWIRGEEYPHEFLRENERSPIRAWLDNPHTIAVQK